MLVASVVFVLRALQFQRIVSRETPAETREAEA